MASESQFLDPPHFVNFTYSFNPGKVFVQSKGEEFVADLEGGSPPSPDYALVSAIEGRALQSEGNGPVPWSVLQTEFVERTPGKNGSDEPSHQARIDDVRLCAFAPPSSSLDR